MPRPARIRISSTKAWKAFLSPVRRQIVESMQRQGPCSIAEVARDIGRPADGLYRHVAVLVKSGFLREIGKRAAQRNIGRMFDATANDFLAPRIGRRASADARNTVVQTAEALAKSSIRALRGSAAAGRIHCERGDRNFVVMHVNSWLTPARFSEVRALVIRLASIIERGRTDRTGEPYEVFAIAAPVTRRGAPGRTGRTKIQRHGDKKLRARGSRT
jgi:DNA-binding Lrp family transcriptional regulator